MRGPRWYPLDRIGELEEAIADRLGSRRKTARRDALACALGLSGLRSAEVSQLVYDDLSVPLGLLWVRTIKGGPPRSLRLDQSLVRQLVDHGGGDGMAQSLVLPNCRGKPVRREQFNRMAVSLFDQLLGRLHGLTFHGLRHTFAMRLYAETGDLFLTQRMLGHSSVRTTEIYARSLAELPESCRVRLVPRLKLLRVEMGDDSSRRGA